MSKIVWLAGLVAVAVGAGVIYLLLSGGQGNSETASIPSESGREVATITEAVAPFSGSGSLVSLLDRATDLECSLTFDLGDSGQSEVREGTLFTSRGRMRSDVLLDVMGQVGVASVIVRDDKFYSWTDFAGQRNGVTVALNDLSGAPADGAGTGAVSLTDPVNFDCQPWPVVDGSVFELPLDIVFTTLSPSTTPVMEDGTIFESPVGTSDPCEVCLLVPAGEGREECLTNFACR